MTTPQTPVDALMELVRDYGFAQSTWSRLNPAELLDKIEASARALAAIPAELAVQASGEWGVDHPATVKKAEPKSPTEVYAEGRGDQFNDDVAVVRNLLSECDDADACSDGRLNTTRIREMLATFEVADQSYKCESCDGSGCGEPGLGCTDCLGTGIDPRGPGTPARGERDIARLDAMEAHRIAVIPEYEGPWDARVYGDEGEPEAVGTGSTPREAIDNAIAAHGIVTKESST